MSHVRIKVSRFYNESKKDYWYRASSTEFKVDYIAPGIEKLWKKLQTLEELSDVHRRKGLWIAH
jgi:hypothetical protein